MSFPFVLFLVALGRVDSAFSPLAPGFTTQGGLGCTMSDTLPAPMLQLV